MPEDLSWTFGDLEGVLARAHEIADSKRTAFQARLKNFHRLNYPIDFKSSKGVTSRYSPIELVDMAIALEVTQLGLPPERIVSVLGRHALGLVSAVRIAARKLESDPSPFREGSQSTRAICPIFLEFDPTALAALTETMAAGIDPASLGFRYVEGADPSLWLSSTRISLLNVTALLDGLADLIVSLGDGERRAWLQRRGAFYRAVAQSADQREIELVAPGEDRLTAFFIARHGDGPCDGETIDWLAEQAVYELGVDLNEARPVIWKLQSRALRDASDVRP